MKTLRKKLDESSHGESKESVIKTKRGLGYNIVSDS